jgi:hypothetical protein
MRKKRTKMKMKWRSGKTMMKKWKMMTLTIGLMMKKSSKLSNLNINLKKFKKNKKSFLIMPW